MVIAFFTENGFTGKVSRTNAGRTDTSWMVALNATHHNFNESIGNKYDLGIIIVPKKDPKRAFSCIETNRKCCRVWATMQEANQTYWQNWSLAEQIEYINFLHDCDMIFCHNDMDKKYYTGLIPGKRVEVLQSLMIEDALPKSITKPEERSGSMIGGNWTEWYSGQDSFFIAQEFNEPIYAPSMGRKHHNEDDLEEISYLPYLNWTQWIAELSKRKYGVHLMRTYAAGTFALNCARLGIPCLGWNFMDTQRLCFPELSFQEGDMEAARKAAQHLRDNKLFYDHCSSFAKKVYEDIFREDKFLETFNSYF
jgi:hypothetical protein